MVTESYQIACAVTPRVKAKHSKLYIASAKKPNSFTFFNGSEFERTLDFHSAVKKSSREWRLSGDNSLREWGFPVNIGWISKTIQRILLQELRHEFPEIGDASGMPDLDMDRNVEITIGRSIQIIKQNVWGLPIALKQEELRLHTAICHCVKASIPESTWKLACLNAGGLYGLYDKVLSDAMFYEKEYTNLYAVHPFLGRTWVPTIREFVKHSIGDTVKAAQYAGQIRSALAKVGVQKSGMRSLHVMADKHPMMLKRMLLSILNYEHLLRETHADPKDTPLEDILILNALNGKKPNFVGVTRKDMYEQAHSQSRYFIPALDVGRCRNVEDIMVIAYVHSHTKRDDRFDDKLMADWMSVTARQRPGALYQGYTDVVRNMHGHLQRKEAVLQWANNAQERWHRNLPRQNAAILGKPREKLNWSPILPGFVKYENDGWQIMELTSSDELEKEGNAMSHCVALYDTDCANGRSHIFSVLNQKGKRVSTLELRAAQRIGVKNTSQRYRVEQNRGYANAKVTSRCSEMVNAFLAFVNEQLKVATKKGRRVL